MNLPAEVLQGVLARGALVLLRLQLGVVLLVAGVPKVREDYPPKLIGFLQNVALEKGHAFYQEFVSSVVLPHAGVFAALVSWGEVMIGLALVLGFATRFTAAAALLMLVNYMFAKGAWPWTPSSNDAAYVAISLALLIGAAGRTLGVDEFLAKRWPRSPLW
ncbi:MAG: DoxX family membrane protein [Gemmatimonadales bacterium]